MDPDVIKILGPPPPLPDLDKDPYCLSTCFNALMAMLDWKAAYKKLQAKKIDIETQQPSQSKKRKRSDSLEELEEDQSESVAVSGVKNQKREGYFCVVEGLQRNPKTGRKVFI